jgi:ubiquinone/menaquinone biosynthesis C-methylase UbiE
MAQRPTEHQQSDLVHIWDAVSTGYDETTYWAMPENSANLEVLLSHIGNPNEKHVIEVGCGSGFTTLGLAHKGARCALLDISPVALDTACEAFTRAGLPTPERYAEDALHSSVPSDSFDAVWNGGVIEHFSDEGKEMLIREMVRMCKPGGRVIILVPNRLCWQLQVRQAWQKARGTWKYGFEDDMSPGRLKRMAKRLGFTKIETYAFNPVAGWHWIPRTGPILRWLGWETIEHHLRRSSTGLVSVLVIAK